MCGLASLSLTNSLRHFGQTWAAVGGVVGGGVMGGVSIVILKVGKVYHKSPALLTKLD